MTILFTIGYEGTDIDRFTQTLLSVGVQQLADVRAVPVSRKPGFSKTKLAERLEAKGVRYLQFRSLGDPKPGREAARAGQFDLFRSIYSSHMKTAEAQVGLEELMKSVQLAPTCLLCFERDPKTCHRKIIADKVSERLDFRTFDLFADDPDRYVRNASKLPSFHFGQGATAA